MRIQFLLALIAAVPVSAATLKVDITGVRPGGRLRVALFRKANGFPGKHQFAFRKWVRPARRGSMRVVFSGLEPGVYAVAVHHDANGNGKMDTTFFGRPDEGWCVSNNAPMRTFGPPKFADARFRLPQKGKTINLRMRY